ncbi:MAG: ComEA family DNA-binding protein [Actinobacteria bacterium]|jgi:competence protein ComEA|nr:ComEA family DNA-binding protein [Actinomycetota bacterium]
MFIDELREKLLHFTLDQRRAIISIGVVAVLIASFFALSSRGEAVEPSKIVQSISERVDAPILVHVAGKVRNPGVYPMLAGSRVNDALVAAGGPLPGTDMSEINLARKVVDGEQIFLGTSNLGSTARGKSGTSSGKVNINRASATQFESLPTIGPVIARRIVEFRKSNGQFISIEDLQKVTGIGAKTFARIKDRITL